jgi:hypothetical protein
MSEDQIPAPTLDPDERDPEAPVADAYEQATLANPADDEERVHVNPDVNEYDAVEQAHIVELDDDYR